jgi:HK97 family phage major capsid protein
VHPLDTIPVDNDARVLECPVVIKAADATGRRFAGVASTPDIDAHHETIDPLGVSFTNPVPLLLHHDQRIPVGSVTFGTPTDDGIPFTAEIPDIDEPGDVKTATDRAAHLVKYGLVRTVSVGLQPLAIEPLKNGVVRVLKSIFRELSLVTVPANHRAAITVVKAADVPPSCAIPAPKERPMKTAAEQITDWTTKRAAHVTRQQTLMSLAAEAGVTLGEDEAKEHDALELEIKNIDGHLERLRIQEQRQAGLAQPVVTKATAFSPSAVSVRSRLEPGRMLARAMLSLAATKGDRGEAAIFAQRYHDTPEVALFLKAAVAPGTTTDAAWAGPLVATQNVSGEFIELLRAATILGKIPNLKKVPFNANIPLQTLASTIGWVGQGAPKPVSKIGFGSINLGFAKAAGIVTITVELARFSDPDAERLVRDDMIASMARFLDQQFIDPTVAAVTNVSPASITNGITGVAATANPLADIHAMILKFTEANMPVAGSVLIMNESNAFTLSTMRDSMGNRVFPQATPEGGTVEGLSVIASNTAGTNIVLVQPRYVLYADTGNVEIDVSTEASVMLDTAPVAGTTALTSLWQQNLIGIRAERFINWKRADDDAVALVTGAAWVPSIVSPA